MAHFAKVHNNIVMTVLVAEQEFIDTQKGTWVQTSYNTKGGKHYDPETGEEDDGVPLRKNFAGIGFTYDSDRDAFIPPQPYNSWILDEDTCLWEAPEPYPENEYNYIWNEESINWELVE